MTAAARDKPGRHPAGGDGRRAVPCGGQDRARKRKIIDAAHDFLENYEFAGSAIRPYVAIFP